MRVGVFDSGVGGLTVLNKLVSKYPKNDYIYFGDTINIPYGEKDIDTLFNLSSKIIEYLISKKVELIVIACGTVSSNCYEKLKSTYNIPIIDIISPTINYVKENNLDCYKLSYDKIKEILGFDIEHSFLKYKSELINYGYIVKKISIKEKYVIIERN